MRMQRESQNCVEISVSDRGVTIKETSKRSSKTVNFVPFRVKRRNKEAPSSFLPCSRDPEALELVRQLTAETGGFFTTKEGRAEEEDGLDNDGNGEDRSTSKGELRWELQSENLRLESI